MITLWGFLLGLPLLALGGAVCVCPEKARLSLIAFKKQKAVIWALVTLAWVWTAYEILTFGVNIFTEFFVGVPVLSQVMAIFAFLYDHFYLLVPVLIFLTVIWMPQSLAMRALTGIWMLIPAELFKTTRLLLPESGFAAVHVFVGAAYAGAILGMYGMFYPWQLEKGLNFILMCRNGARVFGGFCLLLGLSLITIGCTL